MPRQDANNLTVTNVIVGAGELEVDGVNVGYTQDGVTIAYERTIYEVEADQTPCEIKRKRTKEVVTISTTLLEATLENLKMIWGVGGTVTSGDGTSELKFGCESPCDEPEHALWFSGPGPNCKTRFIEIYKAFSMETGEHSYTKDSVTRIPVVFKAIMDSTKSAGQKYGRILDTDDDWVD